MLEYLTRLSRLSTRRKPTVEDVLDACDIVREALRADDAYVIRAGDPHFTRLGAESDPTQYEVKQRGYWLIWRELAASDAVFAVTFTVADRLVTEGVGLTAGAPGTHIATILPAAESHSEMLVLRGPWPEGLSEDCCRFLEAARPVLAGLVAGVIDTSQQQRQQEQLRALADVARAFNEASAVDNVLEAVCTALAKASGFDWVQVQLVNDECSWIVESALNLARHSRTETANISLQGGARMVELAQELNRTRKPLLRPDVFAPEAAVPPDWQAYYERAHILSNGVFPMFFQDKLLGFITFSSSIKREFSESEVEFISNLTSQAATSIKGLRLYQELEEASRIQHFLARTDALTGIPNRRLIEEVLRAECARAQRYAEPVSVVMADLDYFKRINDTLGHDAGDDALKHVAGIARESCRESDFVGRWGGDEFLFILPVTPLDGGLVFAERFRTLIAEALYVPPGSTAAWHMRLSAGVAEAAPGTKLDPGDLFKLADTALYRAKEGGRDRVHSAGPHAAAA